MEEIIEEIGLYPGGDVGAVGKDRPEQNYCT